MPVGVIVALAIWRFIPVHEKEERSISLDLPGAALVTLSLIALVFDFSEAPVWGWLALPTIGIVLLSVLLMGLFLWNESRSSHPLITLSIFRIRNVSGANLMMAPIYAGMLGTFFIATLYMQNVLHYAPFITGLSFLPFPVILAIMSTRISSLVARYGFKVFLIVGPVIASAGMIWLSFMPVDGTYLMNLLPTFVLIPLGMGMTFMPIIVAATSGVPSHEAGLASGLITTSQQMGGALGLSILSGIASSVTSAATNMSATGALMLGFDRAILVASGFMLFALALGAVLIKQPKTVPGAVKTAAQRAAEAGI